MYVCASLIISPLVGVQEGGDQGGQSKTDKKAVIDAMFKQV